MKTPNMNFLPGWRTILAPLLDFFRPPQPRQKGRALHLQQQTGYTCATTVFRMCLKYFKGRSLSERRAMRLTCTDKDGTAYPDVIRALRREGLKVGRLKRVTIRSVEEQLERDKLVALTDHVMYESPHAVLVSRSTSKYFVVHDPALDRPSLRIKRKVVAAARHEGFTVYA